MRIFVILLCLALFSGCQPCDVASEPELKVDFSRMQHLPAYTRVYGLGGQGKNIPFHPDSVNRFPISLLADSTVYIFEAPSQTDTLAIHYGRDMIEFQRKRCGFTMAIGEVTLLPSTTFEQARVISKGNRRGFDYSVTSY